MDPLSAKVRRENLVGRDDEVAEIERVLDLARSAQCGCLVLRGEAGIGKSALLEFAAGRAEGMLVLRATGVEAEADLAFGGLYGLRLQALFRERIVRLPEATRSALLIAAAEDTGDAQLLVRAGAELGLTAEALAPAEQDDLIRTTDRAVAFRHPLVRSAIYSSATMAERQRVHAALANAMPDEEHADRRVWHQALATLTADADVAARLETSARRSRSRSGHASAATAFLRSAELTADDALRTRRLGAAARAAWDAGQPDRARELIARVLPVTEGEERARLLHLRGVIEARAGNLRVALANLIEGAEVSAEPSLTLELLLEAGEAAAFSGELDRLGEIGRCAATVPAAGERDRFIVAVLSGFAHAFVADHEVARAQFADALVLAPALDDPRALIWAANAAAVSGDLSDGLPYSTRAVEVARRNGLLSVLPLALEQHAMVLLSLSRFELAYEAAEEGYRLSQDVGHGHGWHLANLATVEAIWGRLDDARRHCDDVLTISRRRGRPFSSVSPNGPSASLS